MNPKNIRWMLIGSIGLLLLLFIAISTFGTSMISSKSRHIADLKAREELATAQLSRLFAAQKEIERYSYFNEVAKAIIPSDKNQAQAILDISTFALQSGFEIESITFPNSTLGQRAAKPATTQNAAETEAKTTAAAISQAKPFPGVTGLYILPITVAPQNGQQVADNKKVNFPKLYEFLSRLERNRRTAQISEVTLTLDDNSPELNFELDMNVFLKP